MASIMFPRWPDGSGPPQAADDDLDVVLGHARVDHAGQVAGGVRARWRRGAPAERAIATKETSAPAIRGRIAPHSPSSA